jgi:polysaccharide export outer membrane protein
VPSRILLLLLLAISAAGCAGGPRPLQARGGQSLAVLPMTELPPPTTDARDARTYRVGGYDTFEIGVYGVEELASREIRADASGRIHFPLAGAINAGGMTLDEVAREIENRLRGRFVREPHVTVNVKEMVSRTFTVNGEVKEPGIFPVMQRLTLVQAVARARGTTDLASTRDVVVFRTVGDQRMAALYNLTAIQTGHYADPEIFPNDIIVVGDSPGRRLFRDIMQVVPYALSPVVALLQGNF